MRSGLEIDPGKLAEETRFDGVFVLCTSAGSRRCSGVLRYRDLLQVEHLFRCAKVVLRTRPIYHSSDVAIRGHVSCSFLALMLQKELADLSYSPGLVIKWADLPTRPRPPAGGDYREGREIHHCPHCRGRPRSAACSMPRASPCRRICTSAPPDLITRRSTGCSANPESQCRNPAPAAIFSWHC